MRIDRRALIQFFDGDDKAGPYAAAIKAVAGEELGLALLVEFLRRDGKNATCVQRTCTTGGKGHRLDGWGRAEADDGRITLYQVEVKLWARHSVLNEGRQPQNAEPLVQRQRKSKLPDDASADVVRDYKVHRWSQYWDDRIGFKQKALCKVLDEDMKPPKLKPPECNARVEPLACLWDAVHPTGELAPWFPVTVPVDSKGSWITADPRRFTRVWVFSMSAFLRNLDDRELTLDLSATSERLQWLNRIFPHA